MNQPDEGAPTPAQAKTMLDSVIFGGTNICNASCVHCPTNKTETNHVISGVMPFDFFCSIVDQLAEGFIVSKWISFGLYGDALLDPLIVERARYVKRKFPGVTLNINTNGAAYSQKRHASLAEAIDVFTLHVESLKPEIYNYLMRPLRMERVFEKIDLIIGDFGKKVAVGTPLHRLNIGERQDITDYFIGKGCGSVEFCRLSNRCSTNEQFEYLAFKPLHYQCRSDILRNFIVDWDGAVFPCCNDFHKMLPIGQLHDASVREVFDSTVRASFGERLDKGDWANIPTCRSCYWDKFGALEHSEPAETPPCVGGQVERIRGVASNGAGGTTADQLKSELEAVYASTSWRITGPLRALRRLSGR
jgi:radical SAM protein with 4Fe4S-binding SPASM domain